MLMLLLYTSIGYMRFSRKNHSNLCAENQLPINLSENSHRRTFLAQRQKVGLVNRLGGSW